MGAEVSLGWVYLAMGVLIGSAVIPVSFSLLWSKATANGAIIGAIGGQVLAILSWMISAKVYSEDGTVSILSTGKEEPMLIGNLVAILSSGLLCTLVSLYDPDDYDWKSTRNIECILEDGEEDVLIKETEKDLAAALKWICYWGCGFTVVIVIAWPVLSLPAGVFTETYFTFWVVISIIWAFVATLTIIFLPIIESFSEISAVVTGLMVPEQQVDMRKAPESATSIVAVEGQNTHI